MRIRGIAFITRPSVVALACLASLLPAGPADSRGARISRATDPGSAAPPTLVFRGVEKVLSRSEAHPRLSEAVPDGEELSVDDGTSDGDGLLEDGLTLAVRLSPAAYPVRLTAIRIYFVKFSNQPDPMGKAVRLVAFTGSSPKPASGVSYLVDQQVQIPRTGSFVDFPIPDGPVITEGDLWVGYQAPSPASGVGFAADTNGVQSDRTYWLDQGAANWGGPLRFTDGMKANALIRARVATTVPDSGDFELRTDDGGIESGLLRDGTMYVNRLTPPKYPATLTKVRIYVPQMSGQPSPEGKTIKVVAFRAPSGSGAPQSSPKLDVNQAVKMGKPGQFMEVAVDGPEISSGDVYIGFQAPDPHDGVAFALDSTGQPFQRMFRSRDGGQTFTGPISLTTDTDQNLPANLMVRAVVRLGPSPNLDASHKIVTSTAELDVGEGGTGTFECAVQAADPATSYLLAARFDPPAPGLSVELNRQSARAQEKVTVRVTSAGASDITSAPLILEAGDGKSTARLTVPIYLWREIAATTIGPSGGTLSGPAISVAFPGNGFQQERTIRLLTGKPVTGREGSVASPIYRLEGLPEHYQGGLTIRMPLENKAAATSLRRADAADGQVGILQIPLRDPSGKTIPFQMFQPAKVEGGTLVLDVPPQKASVANRFSFWMLSGWYTLESDHGNFYVFYPLGGRDHAVWAAGNLEKALTNLIGPDVDVALFDRISYISTLGNVGVTTHPIRSTLEPNLSAYGVTRLGQIYLDYKSLQQGIDAMRSTPGHELMHIAQNLYGAEQGTVDWWAGRPDPRVWGDEALATWFEPYSVSDPTLIPGAMAGNLLEFVSRGPLSLPGTGAGDQYYGYGASSFITYLHRFVDKRIPARWLAQRTPDREPWALLLPLMGGEPQFARHWRDFGEKLLTKSLLPNAAFPDPVGLMPLAESAQFRLQPPDDRADRRWSQAHDLSMHFFALFTPQGLPTLTDNTMLGFQVLEKYPDVDLYVLGLPSRKFIAMQRGVGELLIDAKDIKNDNAFIVGAVNYSYDPAPSRPSRRDVTLRMGLAEPAIKIRGGVTGSLVIGATYNFTTENRNIPADATYSWNFGTRAANTRSASVSWPAAGTYAVEVTASWLNNTVRDKVNVTVAPDTPPARKAEVLFDVYRRLRNAMGTSNQKCNEYTISISDAAGTVVDGGSSIARNGAYDTILPVGNGYAYLIKYNYTAPCRDSGTAAGKFDVRPDTVNGVRVETPPCEQ